MLQLQPFLQRDNQIKELELRLEKAVKDKQSDFMALLKKCLKESKN